MANVFSDEAVEEIRSMFQSWSRELQNVRVHRPNLLDTPLQVREGILYSELSGSTDDGQTETTATLNIWRGSEADWADSSDTLTVTNRNDLFSFAAGAYITVYRINAEWRPMSGVPLQIVEFTIITANCAAKTAVVSVDARPCGVSCVTGENASEQLTVNDPQGCYLDEPNADLVGREGWAAYMINDYTGVCQWDIFALCCDPDAC